MVVPPVIAVDGPSGSGKSTVASGVARALGWQHLDTGSMYRAVTLHVLDKGIDPADEEAVTAALGDVVLTPSLSADSGEVMLDGRAVDAELRTDAVTGAVSAVAAQRAVRNRLVADQRALIASSTGIVVEGRDIGTAVTPDAPVKVFLTAREDVRAARRAGQNGAPAQAAAVRADIARRDAADAGRAINPTAQAGDAVVLDTSDLSAVEVIDAVLSRWRQAAEAPVAAEETARARPDTRAHSGAGPHPAYSPRLLATLKPIARAVARAIWQITVVGAHNLPPAGPTLIVGNHAGALDGPLLVAFTRRPVRILAKIELFSGPLASLLHRVGQIPVDRGRPDRVALRSAIAVLRQGGVLGIFPEGTRGAGEVRDVRGGAAYLCLHAECVVIPLVCTGTSEALPKGARRPRLREPITLHFGAPITVHVTGDPRARSTLAAATEQIRLGLAAHLDSVRQLPDRRPR